MNRREVIGALIATAVVPTVRLKAERHPDDLYGPESATFFACPDAYRIHCPTCRRSLAIESTDTCPHFDAWLKDWRTIRLDRGDLREMLSEGPPTWRAPKEILA